MYRTKLVRIGNSTGLTVPRELLSTVHMDRGDEVTIEARNGQLEITKVESDHTEAMEKGRQFCARYRRTMAALAK